MENVINRKEIAPGVYFSSVTDSRYKFNNISVNFFNVLDEKTASANAAAFCVLTTANSQYPTYKQLKNRLLRLYGASVQPVFGKRYDLQTIGMSAQFLDDAYALDGEAITAAITDIMTDCLFSPVLENGIFPEKTVELEKQTIIDRIEEMINDKRSYAVNKAVSLLCKGEPAEYFSCGTVEKARALTPQDVYDAYKNVITTMRCEIICVGSNDFKQAEEKFAKAFGEITRAPAGFTITRSSLKEQPLFETETMSVSQSKMVLGFKTQSDDDDALSMVQKIYGGTTSSKLFRNVREKMSLCYYCFASLNSEKGMMLVQCGVENENIEKARDEIIHQLDEIKNGNFTDEDINVSQVTVTNNSNTIYDSVGGVENWYLDRIIRDKVETPTQYAERLLGVSRERIIEAANSLVLDTVYVLTGVEKGDDQ
ncbi:MAG: insulinase family protein [Eubacterium sp.]|nr:insulinase family protein [Eubacterium sp.]